MRRILAARTRGGSVSLVASRVAPAAATTVTRSGVRGHHACATTLPAAAATTVPQPLDGPVQPRVSATKLFAPVLTETPADAVLPSHQLMVRAGIVRQLGMGLYTFLPLGLRALRKLENIIDQEMAAIDCQKLDMPLLMNKELWSKTGRWISTGDEMIRLKDRKGSEYCLGPTHEEAITALVAANVKSYREMPLRLYQIGKKFRDEARPRGALLRAREFVMKDAYTFDVDQAAAYKTYDIISAVYTRILTRIGVPFVKVDADSGNIGGNRSEEFHIPCSAGEDTLLSCPHCKYAANVEKAKASTRPLDADQLSELTLHGWKTSRYPREEDPRFAGSPAEKESATAAVNTILASVTRVADTMVAPSMANRVYVVVMNENQWALAVMRADRDLNEISLKDATKATAMRIAPIIEARRLIRDAAAAQTEQSDASSTGLPLTRVFIDETLTLPGGALDGPAAVTPIIVAGVRVAANPAAIVTQSAQYSLARPGDACATSGCNGKLAEQRGIEVGHVFYLGDKYSKPLEATFVTAPPPAAATPVAASPLSGKGGKDKDKKPSLKHNIEMGCFGFGLSRYLAAAIEASHDSKGMIWPESIAPYRAIIVPISKDTTINQRAEQLYDSLQQTMLRGDIVLDDRVTGKGGIQPGAKLHSADTAGYPWIMVLGQRFDADGTVELQYRRTGEKRFLKAGELIDFFSHHTTSATPAAAAPTTA